MYFKINKTGCSENKGLVDVRYDLFLSKTDTGNEEHYVEVSIFPEGGYLGEKDEMGTPVNIDDYTAWVASLPKQFQNNPFCCHFIHFESTVTDEEILAAGEKVLNMAYDNWLANNLHLNTNDPVVLAKEPDPVEIQAKVESILNTDFVALEKTLPDTYRIRA